MSQFDESKLSRILARRIIAPEDRSQFLPLCTPIYCPDNNGVKASQVTIIDPNLNTFFDDVNPTNTRSKYIGSQLDSTSGVSYNENISVVGTPTIDATSGNASNISTINKIVLGSSSSSQLYNFHIEFNITSDMNSCTILDYQASSGQHYGIIYVKPDLKIANNDIGSPHTIVSNIGVGTHYVDVTANTKAQTSLVSVDGSSSTSYGFMANSFPVTFQLASTSESPIINLYRSTLNGDPLAVGKFAPTVTRQPNEVQNIINIDLNKSVSRDYFVPYEVELKSDADIMSVIKSDFAAYFKNRVSNEIVEQLVLLHTTNAISTINMGASLAATLGDVISTFISQGTGQKFSIYKYNNGAPVVYSEDSNQPNIDKDINQTTDMIFATKDDINVPALYYVEQPTLILPNTTFAEYQTALCNGDIKDYARKMINVETSIANFGQLGEGVFGTNDTFAVAFSAPSIKLVPDTNFYGYRLCCTMLYGVKLIHKHNLRLIV